MHTRADDDRGAACGEDPLDHGLARAAALLRAEVPVAPAWRARVEQSIEREMARAGVAVLATRDRRRLVLAWPAAVAASVALILAGAGGLLVMQSAAARSEPSPAAVAAAPRAGATRFIFVAPAAHKVALVGDFNLWNPVSAPMHRLAGTDAWTIDVTLPPGRHVYAFIVDGDVTPDPAAPRAGGDDFGRPSSVVVVSPRS